MRPGLSFPPGRTMARHRPTVLLPIDGLQQEDFRLCARGFLAPEAGRGITRVSLATTRSPGPEVVQ